MLSLGIDLPFDTHDVLFYVLFKAELAGVIEKTKFKAVSSVYCLIAYYAERQIKYPMCCISSCLVSLSCI